jgi:hypothetical protein
MQQDIHASEPTRVPGRKPGPAQQEELLRICKAVDDDGRKMVLFVARTIAVKQGLAAGGASLLSPEPLL